MRTRKTGDSKNITLIGVIFLVKETSKLVPRANAAKHANENLNMLYMSCAAYKGSSHGIASIGFTKIAVKNAAYSITVGVGLERTLNFDANVVRLLLCPC